MDKIDLNKTALDTLIEIEQISISEFANKIGLSIKECNDIVAGKMAGKTYEPLFSAIENHYPHLEIRDLIRGKK